MSSRIPPQISRIVLLTAVIVALFLVARHMLVPASFNQYGWYRGNAIREIAGLPITFAGQKACAECHGEVVKNLAGSKHKGLSCEACHDACAAHASDPAAVSPAPLKNPRFCVRCHAKDPARPAKFPQVDVDDHAGKQGCTECHQPHNPSEAP